MSSAQLSKLTKKQKKGIAFRERKLGKSKNDQPDGKGGGQDVPIQEAVDQAEIQDSNVEMEKATSTERTKERTGKSDRKGKDKALAIRGDTKVVENAKKRKRGEGETHEGETHEGEKPKQKKIKSVSEDGTKAEKDTSNRGKQRFILFVGMIQSCIQRHLHCSLAS